ncbi:hypothetical protein P7K49_005940 [Saguinus oedipus]|uniref:Uncharacterized protein n=1 Tax=Saguinus oedipus TaxID=9490 RepID=A0ABQ9W2M6_SAGOE|nr:hypothetical protein P7K49_005940 [Saguinus oedipus]
MCGSERKEGLESCQGALESSQWLRREEDARSPVLILGRREPPERRVTAEGNLEGRGPLFPRVPPRSEALSAEHELPWSQQGRDGPVPEPCPDLTASESKGKD